MIQFLVTRGHGYTLDPLKNARGAPAIGVMDYDRLLRSREVPRASYVFADIDRLSYGDLEHASRLYLEMKNCGLRVWNNPAKVKTRYSLLRALHAAGLNDFNAYRVDELNGSVRFPVFLRNTYGHKGPLTDLLPTPEDLQRAIDSAIAKGTPAQHLLVVEYAAEPVRPGLYRKLAAYRLGDAIVPHTSVHDTLWILKTGKVGIAGEELYREEQGFLKTNPFAAHLRKAFDLANIEYGRADFGLVGGRVQIYEINTNPSIAPLRPHPSPVRQETARLSREKFLEALRALDSAGGSSVRLPPGPWQGNWPKKNFWARTRPVP